jgi:hypothetical protein
MDQGAPLTPTTLSMMMRGIIFREIHVAVGRVGLA